MRTFDFAPLHRATIGFDQIADLMDRVLTNDPSHQNYPPYNIEKTAEDAYRITLAVAGYAEENLSIEVKEQSLLITATKPDNDEPRSFLHRGIATRAFERRFHLADHVRVTGATYVNGMLNVDLKREIPEALKPRRIEIASGDTIDVKAVEKKPKKKAA